MLEVATTATETAAPSVRNEPRHDSTGSLRARLLGSLPTLLIVGILVALAVGGHLLGWTLPKFSALTGMGGVDHDDWCKEHPVPESQCVECNPELMPRGKEFGWCKKHGVQECPLCHPEVAQVAGGVQVTAADLERAQKAQDFSDRPENNNKCKLQHRRLQFPSQAAAEQAGVAVGPVIRAPVVEYVVANGEVGYDQTRLARLSSRLPGTVWQVNKQLGDRVQKGEVLALVDAVEVGRTKAEFLQALAQVELRTKLFDSVRNLPTAVPGRTIQEAETALTEARLRLLSAQQSLINLGLPIQIDTLRSLPEEMVARQVQFLGLPETITRGLDPQATTGNLLPIIAPIDGVVVSREAIAGEGVDPAKMLFLVADTQHMWLNLDVRLEDARLVALGQPVVFQADGRKQSVQGKVSWISTAVDEKTRTVKVRAELPNTDGTLRASTFGAGRIVLREESNAIVVPTEAVHWEGCCHIVFVRDKNYLQEGAPKVFHVRKVVPGAKLDQATEIVAGVLPGEVVATRGSGVLRSELLKNNLGDG